MELLHFDGQIVMKQNRNKIVYKYIKDILNDLICRFQTKKFAFLDDNLTLTQSVSISQTNNCTGNPYHHRCVVTSENTCTLYGNGKSALQNLEEGIILMHSNSLDNVI